MSKKYTPKYSANASSASTSKAKGHTIPGIVITLLVFLISAVFTGLVAITKLLPLQVVLLIGAVLLLITVLVALLVANSQKKVRFTLGICLALIVIALLAFVGTMLAQGVGTLGSITQAKTETTHIGVYVREDDPAQALDDAKDYTFGVLDTPEKENVDKSIKELEAKLGSTLDTEVIQGTEALVDGLFSGDLDAIVLPDTYLDILQEIEGYEDIRTHLRELTNVTIHTEVKVPVANPDKNPANEGVFTILISGVDTRGSLSERSRSDVNILATVNTNTHQILLVSTPRDYFIPLSISDGIPDKLTHAGIYGIDVSMDTLAMLYDIDVDYYFRVNFLGFKEIIDSLDGITVHSDYTFYAQGHQFYEGDNEMYGDQALVFARERYSFSEGDRQRGRNQMAVIQGVIDKVLSPDILKNYSSLLKAVEGSFETSVPYSLIASLVRDQLTDGGGWDILTYSVTGSDGSEIPYSMSSYAYVMYPDETTVATAQDLMDQVRSGKRITQPQSK